MYKPVQLRKSKSSDTALFWCEAAKVWRFSAKYSKLTDKDTDDSPIRDTKNISMQIPAEHESVPLGQKSWTLRSSEVKKVTVRRVTDDEMRALDQARKVSMQLDVC